MSIEKAPEINALNQKFKGLSQPARSALDGWTRANWTTGELATSYFKRDDLYREIETVMTPIRDSLRSRMGASIVLYRGMKIRGSSPSNSRQLYSWTSRPKYAALFADIAEYDQQGKIFQKGTRTSFEPLRNIKDNQINQAVRDMRQRGFAKLNQLSFKTHQDDPQWFNTYMGLKEINFGEQTSKFEQYVKSRRQEALDATNEASKNGFVKEERIPIDDIVWIFNHGGNTQAGPSMEFIVNGHSGSKGRKIDPFGSSIR